MMMMVMVMIMAMVITMMMRIICLCLRKIREGHGREVLVWSVGSLLSQWVHFPITSERTVRFRTVKSLQNRLGVGNLLTTNRFLVSTQMANNYEFPTVGLT